MIAGAPMNDLERMLMEQEGTGPMQHGRFFPYHDSVGKLTIGYGHCLDTKGLPPDLALMLLKIDIADAIDDARRVCSIYDQLSRPRQLCLISMAYNLGRDGLNQWPRFIGALHREAWDEAADELLDSKAAREQAPLRYKKLANMMRGNVSQWV